MADAQYNVRVWYKDRQEQTEQIFGPLTFDTAQKLIVAICVRNDVLRARVEQIAE